MANNDELRMRSPMDAPAPVVRPANSQPSPELVALAAQGRTRVGSDVPAPYQKELISWLMYALREGEAMLATEGESENIDENMQLIMGQYGMQASEVNKPSYRSKHHTLRMAKNVNDIASSITDFRPIWRHKTFNPLYERQGKILDKLSESWYYNNAIDLKLQLLAKQSLVARTAYAYVVYNPTLHCGQGDIDILIKDYRDVIPIRPNSKISIQDAFGVIVRSRNTINWAKARYGDLARDIVPTSEGSMLKQRTSRFKVGMSALEVLDAQRKSKDDFAVPTYDHYEVYLKDPSINGSNARVWVGPGPEGKHPWGYWVEAKQPLYPRGRLIVCANLIQVLFDGGNPYWHGMFPLAKLTLDPWAWSYLGKSALADAKSAQSLSIELLQGISDASRKALNPGIITEKNAVPRELLKRFDSREPGWKLQTNPSVGQGIIMETPYPLPQYVIDLRHELDQYIDHVMGVLDMRALQQMKQLAGSQDVEALLEYLGPSIRTKGRILEVFMREIGEMMKCNFFQFYNMNRRIQVLGQEGLDFEDFDFDAGSLVPAFSRQDLQPLGAGETSKFYDDDAKLRPRAERAYAHCRNFTFFLEPNSLLSLAKTQDKLMMLMLFRAGVIDPVTLLETLEVPNIGELPGDPKTIIGRMEAAAAQGYVGAISAAGRKSAGEAMPRIKMTESGG